MGNALLKISALVETPELLIRRGEAEGQTGRPLVIFSCAQANAISGEWLEFYGFAASRRRPVMWVTDRLRSWFGASNMAGTITSALTSEMERLGATEIDTLGGSMGGFGAVAFRSRLPVRNALAFGPRFSASHDIVPDFRLRDHLSQYAATTPFPTISEGLKGSGRAVILHGDAGPDLLHSVAFSGRPKVWHMILPGLSHDVAPTLKARHQLGPVLRSALAGTDAKLAEEMDRIGASPMSEMRPSLLLNRDAFIESLRPEPIWRRAARAPAKIMSIIKGDSSGAANVGNRQLLDDSAERVS